MGGVGRVGAVNRMTLWNGDKMEGEETRVIQLLAVRRGLARDAMTFDCLVEHDPCIETRLDSHKSASRSRIG